MERIGNIREDNPLFQKVVAKQKSFLSRSRSHQRLLEKALFYQNEESRSPNVIPSAVTVNDAAVKPYKKFATHSWQSNLVTKGRNVNIYQFTVVDPKNSEYLFKGVYICMLKRTPGRHYVPHDLFPLSCFKAGEIHDSSAYDRLHNLQVGCPGLLEMTFFCVDNPQAVERHLHSILELIKQRGEWFGGVRFEDFIQLTQWIIDGNLPDVSEMIKRHYLSHFDAFRRHLIQGSSMVFASELPPLIQSNARDGESGNVSRGEMDRLLRRALDHSLAHRHDLSFTGSKLINILVADNRVGIYNNRKFHEAYRIVDNWFPKVLGLSKSEYSQFKSCNTPAEFLARIFSQDGKIDQLNINSLHRHWWLFLSNFHSLAVHHELGLSRKY